ncbi:MAG: RHS repeat protein, partial [Desulfobacterales bacterium]|nr:RHS repeat protein [Desulfobacterales bacterium]
MWPIGATGPSDVTRMRYHEATGLPTAKEYADGAQTTYTYAEGGRLETRAWARTVNGVPLTTTYINDQDTGELLSIDYSDATPDISFTYNRLGVYKKIRDAVGTREFVYNEALQQETETVTGLQNYTITRKYETEGVVGRAAGFSLGADYDVTYGYDDVGRFETVSWTVGDVSQTATYGYLTNTNLIERLTTGDGLSASYTYDP